MWKMLACVLFFIPLLTGCWDMKELEHMFYAHAIGFDYKDGKYQVYVQILNFSVLGKKEAGGTKEDVAAWLGKGEGSTLDSALHQLYSSSQRKIYWGHVTSLVVSEGLLKHGIHDVLDIATRYNELRYTIWIFGTRDSVEKLLLASPILENSPVYSQLGDPTDVYDQSSFTHPVRLNRFIIQMRERGKTPLLPMLSLSSGKWSDKSGNHNAIVMEGIGLLKNGKWNGWLSKKEELGVRWLQKDARRIPLTIYDEKQPIADIIFTKPKPKIISEIRNGKVYFNIILRVTGSIVSMGKEASESSLSSQSAKLIQEEIRQTYMEGLKHDADVLNLLDKLYRKKFQDWRKITTSEEFPLHAESLTIDVKVQISNSGRSRATFPE